MTRLALNDEALLTIPIPRQESCLMLAFLVYVIDPALQTARTHVLRQG